MLGAAAMVHGVGAARSPYSSRRGRLLARGVLARGASYEVYSGGSHVRNISNGTCPGSTAALASPAWSGSPGSRRRWRTGSRGSPSPRANLRYMAKNDGHPVPELERLVKQAYLHSPSATNRERPIRGRARSPLRAQAAEDCHLICSRTSN